MASKSVTFILGRCHSAWERKRTRTRGKKTSAHDPSGWSQSDGKGEGFETLGRWVFLRKNRNNKKKLKADREEKNQCFNESPLNVLAKDAGGEGGGGKVAG